jgi:hypothetical protein
MVVLGAFSASGVKAQDAAEMAKKLQDPLANCTLSI